jgi:hypothetical protein
MPHDANVVQYRAATKAIAALQTEMTDPWRRFNTPDDLSPAESCPINGGSDLGNG